jgi:CRP-like cAMP-binding protein
VRALSAVTHDLMHKDAEKRLVAWLLQQSEGRAQLRLAERKRDIAAQLAITPETLSRMMRQLKEKGLIAVAGYTVQLLDLAGLQALAREG